MSGNQRNSINKETEGDVEVSRETIEEVSEFICDLVSLSVKWRKSHIRAKISMGYFED